MPVTFVKGDFINQLPPGKPHAFACPVDVNGTSDAGIAAAVAKRWPGFGEWWGQQRKQISDVAVFEAGSDLIFALVVQRGQKRSKLGWIDRAVRNMLDEATKRGVTHINVPRLWGGASGLDGARAKRILDEATLGVPIQVTVFEQFIRASEPTADTADATDAAEDADLTGGPTKKTAKKTAKKKTPAKKEPATKAAAAPKKAAPKMTAPKKAAPKTAAPKKAAPKKKVAAKAPPKKKAAAKKKKA